MESYKDNKVLADLTIRRVMVILGKTLSMDAIYNGMVTFLGLQYLIPMLDEHVSKRKMQNLDLTVDERSPCTNSHCFRIVYLDFVTLLKGRQHHPLFQLREWESDSSRAGHKAWSFHLAGCELPIPLFHPQDAPLSALRTMQSASWGKRDFIQLCLLAGGTALELSPGCKVLH